MNPYCLASRSFRAQFHVNELESIIGTASYKPEPGGEAHTPTLPKRPAGEVTRLLAEIREGHQEVEPQLIELVYAEMRRLAARYMRNERVGHTLQPTALVNEAYVRLRQTEAMRCVDRGHFFALAASVMRHLLVDYGKAHRAAKRGAGLAPVSLDEALGVAGPVQDPHLTDALNLSEALAKLAAQSKRVSSVVELRFLGGLTVDETAAELNMSPRTVKRDCTFARAWLQRELNHS